MQTAKYFTKNIEIFFFYRNVAIFEGMKERPILFSSDMVRAILNGTKTQTRRACKDQNEPETLKDFAHEWEKQNLLAKCPYGKPGDVLWIREEHYRFGHWIENGFTDLGNKKWKFLAAHDRVIYFDNPPVEFQRSRDRDEPWIPKWYKRLARFMPKSACRLKLAIKDVSIERLQDISEADAVAEGVERIKSGGMMSFRSYAVKDSEGVFPYVSFQTLWQSINGRESWDENPWVWKLTFEKI